MMGRLGTGRRGKKLSKDQKLMLKQRISQENMYMLQMKNMMNMQRMSDMQSMMVPLAHMKQQNIQNKLQYADMVRDINEQKMKILEMYKEVQMMKQEMLA